MIVGVPLLLARLIDRGVTNAPTIYDAIPTGNVSSIPSSEWQIHKYLVEHPEDEASIVSAYTYMRGRK